MNPPQLLVKLGLETQSPLNQIGEDLELLIFRDGCVENDDYSHIHLLRRIMKVSVFFLDPWEKRQTMASISYCAFKVKKTLPTTYEPTQLITISFWASGAILDPRASKKRQRLRLRGHPAVPVNV